MKAKLILRLLFGVWCLVFLPGSVSAQYSVTWSTIDGGGGTSANGQYSVSGTIGQPDAGPAMSGGNFFVDGGFWTFTTLVQSPNAPTLTIVGEPMGQVTLSWTPATPGWVLQETWSVASGSWSNSISGGANPVTLPADAPMKFYRLFKP